MVEKEEERSILWIKYVARDLISTTEISLKI